jgi:hypothetical protein
MARLRITGSVTYSDGSPASGARVVIRDLDGLGGADDDTILRVTADARGRFTGLSAEWDDREGSVLGVDLPDLLRLEYTVTVEGRRHTGSFIRHDGTRSAPIVVPQLPVTVAERELVQIIHLAQDAAVDVRPLYQFIEASAETLTTPLLTTSYARITFLKDARASLAGFVHALKLSTDRPGVEAVDVLFTTHGHTDRLVFEDGGYREGEVLDALVQGIPADGRAKLRILFSTACFGASHRDMWRDAGFTEVAGSVGIYADAAVSYPAFLTTWALGQTFAQAVDAANAADVGDLADEAARAYYRARGKPDYATEVNCTRRRSGPGTTRVHTKP